MRTFWSMVNQVIAGSDILLLVLDARMAQSTRNIEIERKVAMAGKPIIYVLNKCDLVEKHYLEEYKKNIPGSIFISAKMHLGTVMLRDKIMHIGSRLGKASVTVGVLGYPNVGKSSIINALKGRAAAKTSSISGFTKHIQKVRSSKITFLDTPGVIPYKEKDQLKHSIIGTIDFSKEKEPDIASVALMNTFPGIVEEHFGVPVRKDKERTLEDIAVKRNMIMKGSEPDIMRAARTVLKDWQTGKISSKKKDP